jgi:hypothetical protein
MAKWKMISRPKDQGGVGVINTRIMNDCLLVKWIWKIFQEPDAMWFRIIKAKYMRKGVFFNLVPRVAHNFGRGFIRSSICLSGGPVSGQEWFQLQILE